MAQIHWVVCDNCQATEDERTCEEKGWIVMLVIKGHVIPSVWWDKKRNLCPECAKPYASRAEEYR
jgi:hypothetical protein